MALGRVGVQIRLADWLFAQRSIGRVLLADVDVVVILGRFTLAVGLSRADSGKFVFCFLLEAEPWSVDVSCRSCRHPAKHPDQLSSGQTRRQHAWRSFCCVRSFARFGNQFDKWEAGGRHDC